MTKVNLEVLRTWIAKKCVELLGTEDEVVINFVMDMLEKDRVRFGYSVRHAFPLDMLTGPVSHRVLANIRGSQFPDGKVMQINLTGFFERKTQQFMQQLWVMLLSAQESVGTSRQRPRAFLFHLTSVQRTDVGPHRWHPSRAAGDEKGRNPTEKGPLSTQPSFYPGPLSPVSPGYSSRRTILIGHAVCGSRRFHFPAPL